ncbi:unnamed protein product [Rangifer tarandus platyrhynchus]|uniref:Uncharacterized protein n=2 Tax=Rangifer tarandus platyrhynchus TaxID=3082113 RepID=A0ABN8ZR01_RANTA|nr:unnamed protein product [Rangifer tarandus platyrhynchus]CAI9709456.1 unnamed protein product [Rangifer tarandus platyrhynchus]
MDEGGRSGVDWTVAGRGRGVDRPLGERAVCRIGRETRAGFRLPFPRGRRGRQAAARAPSPVARRVQIPTTGSRVRVSNSHTPTPRGPFF